MGGLAGIRVIGTMYALASLCHAAHPKKITNKHNIPCRSTNTHRGLSARAETGQLFLYTVQARWEREMFGWSPSLLTEDKYAPGYTKKCKMKRTAAKDEVREEKRNTRVTWPRLQETRGMNDRIITLQQKLPRVGEGEGKKLEGL